MDKRIKIKVEHVSKIFKLGKNKEVHALDDISLNIYENEFLAIVGPSGCGKSTLLFIIAGVENTTNGFVYCDDKKIIGPSIGRGVVFQSDAVFPWLTVRQNIEYGPEIRSIPNNEVKEIADTYLKMVVLRNLK
ncbi:MAG: ATP-binding cassette domain-containing protein, partial [Actinobacteria bacterium]|nr:ATP-binding cassette domain-containing protein [Actinomycetota bacterium]